jgi:hypothetical protein
LRHDIFFHVEETEIVFGMAEELVMERLRLIFYNFIFTFPELTFHDCSLAPHQNIYISAK